MRACSLVCAIIVVFLVIDQFYSGLNWERLFVCGLMVVAIWTDCERWLRYKLRKTKSHGSNF